MRGKNKEVDNIAVSNMWNQFFMLLYLFIIGVLFTLGYFLLEDKINDFLNRKKYTPEELKRLDQRAMANLSLEKETKNWNRISDGIHLRTGLRDDPHLDLVIGACTSCHSAKLITQNKATRAGWQSMIRWMQETQGLPELGNAEPKILDYLAKYYAPKKSGRRQNLNVKEIEWYVLNLKN